MGIQEIGIVVGGVVVLLAVVWVANWISARKNNSTSAKQ